MFKFFAVTNNNAFAADISCDRIEFESLIFEKKTEESCMPHIIFCSVSRLRADVSKKDYTWKGKSFAKYYNPEKTERKSIKKKHKEKA